MGMHMLHEKATDIQQVSRQTRKQDTNIVSLKVLLEWVYDVVYWLQLIISKQSFRNSVTGSLFCFEIVNVLDRWMCKGVFDGYPQSKLVESEISNNSIGTKGRTGRKGQKGERGKRETGTQGRKGDREGETECHPIWKPSHLQC